MLRTDGSRLLRGTACSTLLLVLASPAHPQRPTESAQCSPIQRQAADGVADDFGRLLEITGARPSRPNVIRRGVSQIPSSCAALHDPLGRRWYHAPDTAVPAAIEILPLRAVVALNTGYPRDANNGALWAGRGLSGGVTGGVIARYGAFTAGFAPAVYHQQNDSFSLPDSETPGYSPFTYPWHGGNIDLPLRHGPDAFTRIDLGNSFARVDAYGVVLGVSNENVWWGPALHNPLLFSNTAPGFPHVFTGTSRPVAIGIGQLEVHALWGVLEESDYFDSNPDNDQRLLAGLIANFEPRGLRGLYLGIARTYMTTIPPDGFSLGDYIVKPYRSLRDNPLSETAGDNQILSLFFRWALPASGFEAYAEWARDDHFEDIEDLAKEPDHSQVYTLGLQKVVELRPDAEGTAQRWLRLYGELTHLEGALPLRAFRSVVVFYTNGYVRQGHTNRGQMLGASIGPGSDAQILGADLFTSRGRIGVYGQRIRYDDDAYYSNFGRFYGYHGHDVELTAGIRQLVMFNDVELGWRLSYSNRYNRNFVGLESQQFDSLFSDKNWGVELSLAWRPRLGWPVF